MKPSTLRNLLSLVLACCVAGMYCVMYMFHIFNMVDQVYVPERHIRWVIEEPQTLVKLQVVPPLIAEDTYTVDVQDDNEKNISTYTGPHLTAIKGTIQGPNGKETWYNLSMDRIIQTMRRKGYTEDEYPYTIREDGAKMLGDYVMIAADLNKYKRGDIVETSLGTGIVCDTGDFTETSDVEIDIATNW